ncbi:hypothetical protein AAFF_G00075290 [Aldrovandia affinis]|uniref:Uncharacterized protein n=1 Tax=Aldrovandia affinis TaxID=143900 RepID=A0AAD7RY17_9TELE|nr:hypothetical protein AAFF_G00075290 [Aldrovandia affinis]
MLVGASPVIGPDAIGYILSYLIHDAHHLPASLSIILIPVRRPSKGLQVWLIQAPAFSVLLSLRPGKRGGLQGAEGRHRNRGKGWGVIGCSRVSEPTGVLLGHPCLTQSSYGGQLFVKSQIPKTGTALTALQPAAQSSSPLPAPRSVSWQQQRGPKGEPGAGPPP